MKTKRTCPLIDRECMGRDCALAVFVNSANVSTYNILWCCGLVANEQVFNHGNMRIVDSMSKDDYEKGRWGR